MLRARFGGALGEIISGRVFSRKGTGQHWDIRRKGLGKDGARCFEGGPEVHQRNNERGGGSHKDCTRRKSWVKNNPNLQRQEKKKNRGGEISRKTMIGVDGETTKEEKSTKNGGRQNKPKL